MRLINLIAFTLFVTSFSAAQAPPPPDEVPPAFKEDMHDPLVDLRREAFLRFQSNRQACQTLAAFQRQACIDRVREDYEEEMEDLEDGDVISTGI